MPKLRGDGRTHERGHVLNTLTPPEATRFPLENLSLRQELEKLEDAVLVERLRRLRPELHNTTDLTDRERLTRAIEIAEGERQPAAEAI